MYVCVSGGKKMFVFQKIWRALFSRNTRFEIRPFALQSTISNLVRFSYAASDEKARYQDLYHRQLLKHQ